MPEEVTLEERTVEEHLRQQAWNYFQMHAAQRLTTFNFYLALSTALTAAIFVTFQEDYQVPSVGMILSLLLVLFSFVFWKLDSRNRELISFAEEALRYFEGKANLSDEDGKPHRAKLFTREARVTEDAKQAHAHPYRFWEWRYSYTTCLRAVILAFSVAGLATCIASLSFLLA
jgi:hypothetical protein